MHCAALGYHGHDKLGSESQQTHKAMTPPRELRMCSMHDPQKVSWNLPSRIRRRVQSFSFNFAISLEQQKRSHQESVNYETVAQKF